MNDYVSYYRKYYSKYYNNEAIKQHMIEKKIYSPSDFRYYSTQLLEEIGNTNSIKLSHDMLHEFEKKYIEDSIAFLFNQKKQNDESGTLSSIFSSFLQNLVSQDSSNKSTQQNLLHTNKDNNETVEQQQEQQQQQQQQQQQVTKEEETLDDTLDNDLLKKLLNLLNKDQLEQLNQY